MTPKKAIRESRKTVKCLHHGFYNFKQIPKFSGERNHFVVWFSKAIAVCALNGVSPTLKPGFKDMLLANDAIPLDKKNPNEF